MILEASQASIPSRLLRQSSRMIGPFSSTDEPATAPRGLTRYPEPAHWSFEDPLARDRDGRSAARRVPSGARPDRSAAVRVAQVAVGRPEGDAL